MCHLINPYFIFSFQISNLKDSIASLQGELKQLENGNYQTRLALAFITASAFDFKDYQRGSLPLTKQAVDVWILRYQVILLTKNSNSEDSMVNMLFPGFTSTLRNNFGQDVIPTKQPFNQGLVLENGQFRFVNMNISETYEVRKTPDMSQTYRTFSQLIN